LGAAARLGFGASFSEEEGSEGDEIAGAGASAPLLRSFMFLIVGVSF
jgi:hypothetical protein